MKAGRWGCTIRSVATDEAEESKLTHPHLDVAKAPLITPPKLLPVVIKLLTSPTSRPLRFTGAASTSKTVAVVKMPFRCTISDGVTGLPS